MRFRTFVLWLEYVLRGEGPPFAGSGGGEAGHVEVAGA